jgi:hypothetical protein
MEKQELLPWENESIWTPKLVIPRHGKTRASGYQSWLFPDMGKREHLDTKACYSQTWEKESFWAPKLVIT